MANAMGIEDFSCAVQWAPLAAQALHGAAPLPFDTPMRAWLWAGGPVPGGFTPADAVHAAPHLATPLPQSPVNEMDYVGTPNVAGASQLSDSSDEARRSAMGASFILFVAEEQSRRASCCPCA